MNNKKLNYFLKKFCPAVFSLFVTINLAQADEFYYNIGKVTDPDPFYRRYGQIESLQSTFNSSTNRFKLKIKFSPGEDTGELPKGLWWVVSDGPEPKNQDITSPGYAEAYLDATDLNNPVLSVYKYNWAMNGTSYLCGDKSLMMTGTCTTPPSRIISSKNNDSFIKKLVVSEVFDQNNCGRRKICRVFDLDIDATTINNFILPPTDPTFAPVSEWKGMKFAHQVGWWIHWVDSRLVTAYHRSQPVLVNNPLGYLSRFTYPAPPVNEPWRVGEIGRYDTLFETTYDCKGEPRAKAETGQPAVTLFPGLIFDKCNVCGGADACLGCDGIPDSGKTVDSCGVCGGNNGCLGCDGVPYSGKVYDSCGVCGGDGSSCRPTPVPTPPVGCDGVRGSGKVVDNCGVCGGNNSCTDVSQCQQSDITSNLFALDGVTNSLRGTVVESAKKLVKLGGKRAYGKLSSSIQAEAKRLNTQGWTAIWSYGQTVLTCPTTVSTCSVTSFASNASTVDSSARKLSALNSKLTKQLSRVRTAKAKKIVKSLNLKAKRQLAEIRTILAKLPKSRSVCR